ncbi:MAG TPA: hypothetical protein VGD43_17570 [Micromonospora sp.]
MDHRQTPLAALGDAGREGRSRRHAGDLLMTEESVAADAGAARTADITPGPGGVMTDEVGVVTGPLTLRTEFAAGQVALRVRYKDAEEWYAVTGGHAPLADPAAIDAVHSIAVGLLNRPEG